jgi:hypothetical protein
MPVVLDGALLKDRRHAMEAPNSRLLQTVHCLRTARGPPGGMAQLRHSLRRGGGFRANRELHRPRHGSPKFATAADGPLPAHGMRTRRDGSATAQPATWGRLESKQRVAPLPRHGSPEFATAADGPLPAHGMRTGRDGSATAQPAGVGMAFEQTESC